MRLGEGYLRVSLSQLSPQKQRIEHVNMTDKRQSSPEPILQEAVEAPAQDAAIVRLQITNEQLQTALRTRIVIEQAKGILAERLTLSVDEAFALLRRAARTSRLPLRALASAVVADMSHTPEAILASMRAGLARPDSALSRVRGDAKP